MHLIKNRSEHLFSADQRVRPPWVNTTCLFSFFHAKSESLQKAGLRGDFFFPLRLLLLFCFSLDHRTPGRQLPAFPVFISPSAPRLPSLSNTSQTSQFVLGAESILLLCPGMQKLVCTKIPISTSVQGMNQYPS